MRREGEMKTVGQALEAVIEEHLPALSAVDWDAHEQRLAHERAREQARAERERQRELRKELLAAGCPDDSLERVMPAAGEPDLGQWPAMEAAQLARNAGEQWLVLGGDPGTGKTTAAAWWLSRPWAPIPGRATMPVLWLPALRLVSVDTRRAQQMRELELARALVLDDLGQEVLSPGVAALVDHLVSFRHAQRMPTAITTNLTVLSRRGADGVVVERSQFRGRYGERVARRLAQVAIVRQIKAGELMAAEERRR